MSKLNKLWMISQDICNGYDTYDSAIVSASNESEARKIHPSGEWMGAYAENGMKNACKEYKYCSSGEWVQYKDIKHVKVEYLGITKEKTGVILASFNAG